MKVVPRPPSRPSRRRPATFFAILAVAVLILGGTATFYTEVLWFQETGYEDVFWTGVRTRLMLGMVFGATFSLLLLLNLWIARKITNPSRLFNLSDAVFERYRAMLQPYAKWSVIGASVVFGLFAGSGASVMWRDWLLFRNGGTFGEADPVFGRDVGFYVFDLPFLQFVFAWLFSTLVVIAIATGITHYFLGGIRPQAQGADRVSPEVRAHLSVLLGLIVLVKAWGYRLDQFELLFSGRGAVTGASYTDVNAELPALRLLVVIAVICAVLFIVNAWLKNWILPIGGIGLLALTSLIAGGLYPAAIQRLRVEPNEAAREAPFIERNIKFTRQAFGIDNVESRAFTPGGELTPPIARAHPETIQNIRLWEPEIVNASYLQLQRIKQYYEFLDVDVDRYKIGDDVRQVMLSAREIAPEDLAPSSQTWVNQHLVYTHGYGAVASRVDRADGEGRPSFLINDLPPESIAGAPRVTQPRIYFGENDSALFSIVRTEEKELDYPQSAEGGAFATNEYAGEGGVPLGSVLRRSAFAWRFRDPNILISGALTNESKILYHRQIHERVRRIAPFLKFDSDPYLVIRENGRLVWMLDAYTTTDVYPYAQRVDLAPVTANNLTGRANYIRNAVKFVIDAEHGTMEGYVWDESDPLIKTWTAVFPGTFKPKAELPQDLLEHVRYPEDMFRVQSERFALYHVTNPRTFYSNEDAWSVAIDPNSGANVFREVPPYYLLLEPPGEEEVAFTLVRPYTPNRRQNLSGYLMAHSDPDRYGELISYELPESDVEPGPEQARTRIEGNSEIAPQLNLLRQGGSQLIYGNLLIVPIEDRLLYVQPVYVTGGTTRLPELKRVAIITGARVVMAETLAGALRAAFGGESGFVGEEDGQEDDGTATVADLLARALAADTAAQQALARGDFAAYGERVKEMREAIRQAARQAGATPSPSPSPSG